MLYLQALNTGDWGNACRALENIGKHLGIYERDNRQKVYSENDAARLRAELEEAGFDMERVNFNPSNVPPPSDN